MTTTTVLFRQKNQKVQVTTTPQNRRPKKRDRMKTGRMTTPRQWRTGTKKPKQRMKKNKVEKAVVWPAVFCAAGRFVDAAEEFENFLKMFDGPGDSCHLLKKFDELGGDFGEIKTKKFRNHLNKGHLGLQREFF